MGRFIHTDKWQEPSAAEVFNQRQNVARLGQQAFQQSQKNTNDTVGNGFFGHMVDAAQANAAGLFAGQLRAVDEGLNWAGEKLGLAEKTGTRDKSGWLEQAAQAMDKVQRRNTAQEELTGLNYLAQQVGSVLGSMAAMTGETAVAAAAIGAAVPALGAAAAGAGTVASAARLAGIASRLNKFANAAKTASLMPKTGKAIDAARKMWGSGYLQNYYKLQMMNSPAEALGQAGNLLKQLEDEGYDRDTIRAAALWSGTLNAAFLHLANMAEGKMAALGAKAIASNPATPEALKTILKPTMLGVGATLGKAARTAAWQGLSEGGEEATQDYIDQFATQAAQGKSFGDMTWDHATAAKSFVDAAVGSAALGLLGGATNYRSRAKNFNANGHNFQLSDDGRTWSVDGNDAVMKPAFNKDGTPVVDKETGEHIQTPQPYTAKEIAALMGNDVTESDVRGAMRTDRAQTTNVSSGDARPTTVTPDTKKEAEQQAVPGFTINEDDNGNVISYVDNISGVEYKTADGWRMPADDKTGGTQLFNINSQHFANANGSEAAAAATQKTQPAAPPVTPQPTPQPTVKTEPGMVYTPEDYEDNNPADSGWQPMPDGSWQNSITGEIRSTPPATPPPAPPQQKVEPNEMQKEKLGVAEGLLNAKKLSRNEYQKVAQYINEHPEDDRNMEVVVREVTGREKFTMPSAEAVAKTAEEVKQKQDVKKVGNGTTYVDENGKLIHVYETNTMNPIAKKLDKLKNELYDPGFITNDEYEKAIEIIYKKHGKNIEWAKMLSAIRGKSFRYPTADEIAKRRAEIENGTEVVNNAETVNTKPEEVKVKVPKNDNQGKPEVGEGSKPKEEKVEPKPERKKKKDKKPEQGVIGKPDDLTPTKVQQEMLDELDEDDTEVFGESDGEVELGALRKELPREKPKATAKKEEPKPVEQKKEEPKAVSRPAETKANTVVNTETDRVYERLPALPKDVEINWKGIQEFIDDGYQFKRVQVADYNGDMYVKLSGTYRGAKEKQGFLHIPNWQQYTANELILKLEEQGALSRHLEDALLRFYKNNGVRLGSIISTLTTYKPSPQKQESKPEVKPEPVTNNNSYNQYLETKTEAQRKKAQDFLEKEVTVAEDVQTQLGNNQIKNKRELVEAIAAAQLPLKKIGNRYKYQTPDGKAHLASKTEFDYYNYLIGQNEQETKAVEQQQQPATKNESSKPVVKEQPKQTEQAKVETDKKGKPDGSGGQQKPNKKPIEYNTFSDVTHKIWCEYSFVDKRGKKGMLTFAVTPPETTATHKRWHVNNMLLYFDDAHYLSTIYGDIVQKDTNHGGGKVHIPAMFAEGNHSVDETAMALIRYTVEPKDAYLEDVYDSEKDFLEAQHKKNINEKDGQKPARDEKDYVVKGDAKAELKAQLEAEKLYQASLEEARQEIKREKLAATLRQARSKEEVAKDEKEKYGWSFDANDRSEFVVFYADKAMRKAQQAGGDITSLNTNIADEADALLTKLYSSMGQVRSVEEVVKDAAARTVNTNDKNILARIKLSLASIGGTENYGALPFMYYGYLVNKYAERHGTNLRVNIRGKNVEVIRVDKNGNVVKIEQLEPSETQKEQAADTELKEQQVIDSEEETESVDSEVEIKYTLTDEDEQKINSVLTGKEDSVAFDVPKAPKLFRNKKWMAVAFGGRVYYDSKTDMEAIKGRDAQPIENLRRDIAQELGKKKKEQEITEQKSTEQNAVEKKQESVLYTEEELAEREAQSTKTLLENSPRKKLLKEIISATLNNIEQGLTLPPMVALNLPRELNKNKYKNKTTSSRKEKGMANVIDFLEAVEAVDGKALDSVKLKDGSTLRDFLLSNKTEQEARQIKLNSENVEKLIEPTKEEKEKSEKKLQALSKEIKSSKTLDDSLTRNYVYELLLGQFNKEIRNVVESVAAKKAGGKNSEQYDMFLQMCCESVRDAAATFNPTKGAKLSTHVYNYLKGIKSIETKGVAVSEREQKKINDFNKAKKEIEKQLGRELKNNKADYELIANEMGIEDKTNRSGTVVESKEEAVANLAQAAANQTSISLNQELLSDSDGDTISTVGDTISDTKGDEFIAENNFIDDIDKSWATNDVVNDLTSWTYDEQRKLSADRASIVKLTEQDTEVRNRILTPENEKKVVAQLQQLFSGYGLKNVAPHVYEVTLPNNNKLHIDMTSTSVQLIDKLGNTIGSLMDIAGLQGNIAVAGLYSADKGINLIRLTDAVRDGTVPHEVAHFVFNAVFNETERRKILDYYKSKIVDKTGLTEKQLNRRAEEMFCDDFAEYFLNNKSEPKSKLQRMFEKMKRFLRKLVDMFSFKNHPYTEEELDVRRDDVNVNEESLAALFGRIANGDVYNRTFNDGNPANDYEAAAIKQRYTKQAAAIKEKYRGTPEYGKAPNGKKSNLPIQLWCVVRTPEFKRWAGDWENDPEHCQVILDDNGEPRIIYHGTNGGLLKEFDTTLSGGTIFATDSRLTAASYPDIFAARSKVSKIRQVINNMSEVVKIYDKLPLVNGLVDGGTDLHVDQNGQVVRVPIDQGSAVLALFGRRGNKPLIIDCHGSMWDEIDETTIMDALGKKGESFAYAYINKFLDVQQMKNNDTRYQEIYDLLKSQRNNFYGIPVPMENKLTQIRKAFDSYYSTFDTLINHRDDCIDVVTLNESELETKVLRAIGYVSEETFYNSLENTYGEHAGEMFNRYMDLYYRDGRVVRGANCQYLPVGGHTAVPNIAQEVAVVIRPGYFINYINSPYPFLTEKLNFQFDMFNPNGGERQHEFRTRHVGDLAKLFGFTSVEFKNLRDYGLGGIEMTRWRIEDEVAKAVDEYMQSNENNGFSLSGYEVYFGLFVDHSIDLMDLPRELANKIRDIHDDYVNSYSLGLQTVLRPASVYMFYKSNDLKSIDNNGDFSELPQIKAQLVSEQQANNIPATAKAVQKAKEMYAKGASDTEVWKKTGCIRYNDGTIKLYVPFSDKNIRGMGLPKDFDLNTVPVRTVTFENNPIQARVRGVDLTDVLTENNKLLDIVPSLRDTKVYYIFPATNQEYKKLTYRGFYKPQTNTIYLVVPPDNSFNKSTLAHELQHAIQYDTQGAERDAKFSQAYDYDNDPTEREARYAQLTFGIENAIDTTKQPYHTYDSFVKEKNQLVKNILNNKVFLSNPKLCGKIIRSLESMAETYKDFGVREVTDVVYLETQMMGVIYDAESSGKYDGQTLTDARDIYNGLRTLSKDFRVRQLNTLQSTGRISMPSGCMVGEDTDNMSSTPEYQAMSVVKGFNGTIIGVKYDKIPTLDGKPTTDEIGGAIVNANNKLLKKLKKDDDIEVRNPLETGDENNNFGLLDLLRSPFRLSKKFPKVFRFFQKIFSDAYEVQNRLRYEWHNKLKDAVELLGNAVEDFNLFNDLMLYGDSHGDNGLDFTADQLNGMVYYIDTKGEKVAKGGKVFIPSDDQYIPADKELYQLPENVAKAYLKVRELSETIYAAVDKARRSGLIKTEKANLKRILEIADPKNKEEGYVEIKGSDGQYHSLDEFRQYLNDKDTYDVRYAKIRVVDKNAVEVNADEDRVRALMNDDTIKVLHHYKTPGTNGQQYTVEYIKYMPHMGHRRGHVPHIFERWMVAYTEPDGTYTVKNGKQEPNMRYVIQDSKKTVNEARESVNQLRDDDASKGIERHYVIFPKAFDFNSFNGADEVTGGGALATQKQKQEMFAHLVKNYEMTPEEANQAVNTATRTSIKNRIYGQAAQRKNVAGFSKDVIDALIREVTSASRYCAMQPAKHGAMDKYEQLFGMSYDADVKISDNPLQAMVKSYIDDCNGKPSKAEQWLNRSLNNWKWYRDNISATYGDRAILQATSVANQITSMAKLGFWNISSAVVNLFQNMNTIALCGFGHFGEGVKAFRDLKFKDKDKLTGKELADYLLNEQIIEQTGVKYDIGMDSALGYQQRLSRIRNESDVSKPQNLFGIIYENYLRIGDKGLALFSAAESANRQICVLTAYRDGRARGMTHEDAIEYAKEVNKKANFDYGVADTPAFMRAMSGTGVGEMMLLFQKYPVKELELMCEMCKKALSNTDDDRNQAARFWGMYFLMSGIGGIPFLDGFDEWLEHLFGYKPSKRAKLELINEFGDNAFTRSVCYGVGAAAGIDISQRVGMGDMKFGNDQLMFPFNFGGAAGSTLKQMIEAGMEGDPVHIAKAFSPSFGAILEAGQGYSTDKKGRLRTLYSVLQMVVRGTGFRPIEDSVHNDLNTALIEQRSDDRSEKSAFKYRMALKQTQGQPLTADDQEKLRRMGITGKQLADARRQIKQSFSTRVKEKMSKEQRQKYGAVYEELEAEDDAI